MFGSMSKILFLLSEEVITRGRARMRVRGGAKEWAFVPGRSVFPPGTGPRQPAVSRELFFNIQEGII
jgi:hypothetical protein